MSSISQNIEQVRARMEDACRRAGRPAQSVRLMAVTKYVAQERISQAIDAGITLVGENRVQEMKDKLNFLKYNGLEVHLIGQLQSNKIKYVCGKVDMIQSVDRIELVDQLHRYAEGHGVAQDVMLQVNIGDEPQKGGVSLDGLYPLMERAAASPHIRVCGLMCVPPALSGEEARPYFRRMRVLFEGIKNNFPSQPVAELSMGMSHDFETAIEEGATLVRVGSAIFGARDRL